jgi:hypothetical protein
MKYIYVLIDKETNGFWANTKNYNRKRAIQAYTSEGRALAALSNFWPKVEPDTVVVKKFREITQ